MSKQSWDDAPEWANYRARDQYGGWYWYELKPIWYPENEEWDKQDNSKCLNAPASFKKIDGANSLEARP